MNRAIRQMGPFFGWSMAWLAVAGLLVVVLGGRSGAAPAEEVSYKTLEAEISATLKKRKELSDRTSDVRAMLAGRTPISGNESAFDEYYLNHVFPNWTLTTAESLGALAKDRDRFITMDLGKSVPQAHDRLVDLTFTKMSQIAQDPEFHPGVRYNAVLLLGALNTKEADRVAKVNPEPLPKALDLLVGLFKKADESDAVQVAALLGILRHLEWDDFRPQASRMPAATKADIVKELIALAQATTPPEGRSPEGHTWMRRRAVEGLMYVSQAGPTAEIAGVIEKLVASNADPVALRCTAADIMGRLDYQASGTPPAPEPNAKELGYLALVACRDELVKLENKKKVDLSRNRTSGGLGMDGMGMGGIGAGMAPVMGPGGVDPRRSGMSPTGMMDKMKGTMDSNAYGPRGSGAKGMTPGMPMGRKTKAPKAKTMPAEQIMPAMPGEGLPGSPQDTADPRVESMKRRLRAWLYAVQIGLGDEKANSANEVKRISGIGANAKYEEKWTRGIIAYAQAEPQKAHVKDVIEKTRNIISVVEAPDLDYEDFVDDVRAAMKALETITKPLTIPKTDAATPADEVPGSAAPVRSEAAAKGSNPADVATDAVPGAADVPAAAPALPGAEVPAVPAAPSGGKSP